LNGGASGGVGGLSFGTGGVGRLSFVIGGVGLSCNLRDETTKHSKRSFWSYHNSKFIQ
jgi:hypothetical protein